MENCSQIDTTNQVYESIIKENSQFNEQTEQFNDAKLQFYKSAGIKI